MIDSNICSKFFLPFYPGLGFSMGWGYFTVQLKLRLAMDFLWSVERVLKWVYHYQFQAFGVIVNFHLVSCITANSHEQKHTLHGHYTFIWVMEWEADSNSSIAELSWATVDSRLHQVEINVVCSWNHGIVCYAVLLQQDLNIRFYMSGLPLILLKIGEGGNILQRKQLKLRKLLRLKHTLGNSSFWKAMVEPRCPDANSSYLSIPDTASNLPLSMGRLLPNKNHFFFFQSSS